MAGFHSSKATSNVDSVPTRDVVSCGTCGDLSFEWFPATPQYFIAWRSFMLTDIGQMTYSRIMGGSMDEPHLMHMEKYGRECKTLQRMDEL